MKIADLCAENDDCFPCALVFLETTCNSSSS